MAKKAARKKKDVAAPKRGMSAFFLFANSVRADVKKKEPTLAFGAVGKVIGERWRALSAKEKAPFAELAVQDKLRYAAEMKNYSADIALGPSSKDAKKSGIRLSPYLVFAKEVGYFPNCTETTAVAL